MPGLHWSELPGQVGSGHAKKSVSVSLRRITRCVFCANDSRWSVARNITGCALAVVVVSDLFMFLGFIFLVFEVWE